MDQLACLNWRDRELDQSSDRGEDLLVTHDGCQACRGKFFVPTKTMECEHSLVDLSALSTTDGASRY